MKKKVISIMAVLMLLVGTPVLTGCTEKKKVDNKTNTSQKVDSKKTDKKTSSDKKTDNKKTGNKNTEKNSSN